MKDLYTWIAQNGVTIVSAVLTGLLASLAAPWMKYWADSKADRKNHQLRHWEEELNLVYEPVVRVLNRYLDPLNVDYQGIDGRGVEDIRRILDNSLRYADELHGLFLDVISEHIAKECDFYDEDGRLATHVSKHYQYLRRRLGYSHPFRAIHPLRWSTGIKSRYQLWQSKLWLKQHRRPLPTVPTPLHDPATTDSAPQSPEESPASHPKTSDDDANHDHGLTHGQ